MNPLSAARKAPLFCLDLLHALRTCSGRGTKRPPAGHAALIVKLDAIGDYMLFRQALRALPGSPLLGSRRLVLCGNAVWQPLAEALDADVIDAFIPVDRCRFNRSASYRLGVLRAVAGAGADLALHPTWSRDYPGDCLTLAGGAPRRIGFQGRAENIAPWLKRLTDRWYTAWMPESPGPLFETDRYADVVRFAGAVPGPFQDGRPVPDRLVRPEFRRLAGLPVFFVGASAPAKRWPLARWLRLGEALCRKFPAILICGGPDVAPAQVRTAGQADNAPDLDGAAWAVDLRGRTTLPELAALIRAAPLIISNESAAGHMAATFGTPGVILSTGHHYGRFTPYPARLAPGLRTVFPPGLDRDDPALLARLHDGGSHLSIRDITEQAVLDLIPAAPQA